MGRLNLAAVAVKPGDLEAEVTEAADAVLPALYRRPPLNVALIINPEFTTDLYSLKVEAGGKDSYAPVVDPEVIEAHRSRFVVRKWVVAFAADGLFYVFNIGHGSDSWSKSGRRMIAAAEKSPIRHWTDTTTRRYRFEKATKKLGKIESVEWKFDDLGSYIELALDGDMLIDSMDHELVAHFEEEATESSVKED